MASFRGCSTRNLLEARLFLDFFPSIVVGGTHAGGHYTRYIFSACRVHVEYLRVCRAPASFPSHSKLAKSTTSLPRVFHEYPAWRLTRPDSRVLASLGRVVLHCIIDIFKSYFFTSQQDYNISLSSYLVFLYTTQHNIIILRFILYKDQRSNQYC